MLTLFVRTGGRVCLGIYLQKTIGDIVKYEGTIQENYLRNGIKSMACSRKTEVPVLFPE
jgi:hypothetical protein